MATDATGIRIRGARPEEACVLTGIAHAAKRFWGYSEELITLWKPALTVTPDFVELGLTFAAELHQPAATPQIVGFVGCERTPTNTLEVVHLWVLPECMNRRIGRQLWNRAIQLARDCGCTAIELDSDPHARRFYEKLGARHIADVPSIPVERQLPRMRYELPADPC